MNTEAKNKRPSRQKKQVSDLPEARTPDTLPTGDIPNVITRVIPIPPDPLDEGAFKEELRSAIDDALCSVLLRTRSISDLHDIVSVVTDDIISKMESRLKALAAFRTETSIPSAFINVESLLHLAIIATHLPTTVVFQFPTETRSITKVEWFVDDLELIKRHTLSVVIGPTREWISLNFKDKGIQLHGKPVTTIARLQTAIESIRKQRSNF